MASRLHNSVDSQLMLACEHYFDLLMAGSAPGIDDFVAQYPELADSLRPALLAAQSMRQLNQQILGFQPGAEIGDFRICRLLARGGMGEVYEAEQLSIGRVVALKVLTGREPGQSSSEAALIRFENEIRASAALDHPQIVPLFAVGQEAGVRFFAMRLIDGVNWRQWNEELSSRETAAVDSTTGYETKVSDRDSSAHRLDMGTKRRDWQSIASAVRDVAEGLQHAHERGVLHRDIKPQNLLRDRQGHSWIVDFGLASFPNATSLTITGELIGTIRYMSPEQAKAGAVRIDERADIYSLGATFYEMLTARPVIASENRAEQLRAILTGAVLPLRRLEPQLPVALEIVVMKMLAHDPADRYQSAQEVVEDLNRLLTERSIVARRLSWAQKTVRWSRARAGLMLVAAVLLAVGTIGLGLLVGQLLRTRSALRDQLQISHAAEAHAHVTSRKPGQRYNALASISDATAIESPQAIAPTLRNSLTRTAATALSLCDARIVQEFARPGRTSLDSAVFSVGLEYCTQSVGNELLVLHTATEKVVARLPMATEPMTVCFSGQGERLSVLRGPENEPTLEMWDWHKQMLLWSKSKSQLGATPRRFATDAAHFEELLAVGLENGHVAIIDEQSGELRRELLGPDAAASQVKFSGDGQWLAATFTELRLAVVWELATGKRLAEWKMAEDTFVVAWSQDNSTLAVGSGFSIFLYSTATWKSQPMAELSGPHEIIANAFFHPLGRWLAVYGYDGKTRLWDCHNRSVILELDGHAHFFDPNESRLAFRTYDSIGVWELALDDVVWHQNDRETRLLDPDALAFLNDGQWLMTSGSMGCHLWDANTRRRILELRGCEVTDLVRLPLKASLLIACTNGLYLIEESALFAAVERNQASVDFPWTTLAALLLPIPVGERPMLIGAADNGQIIGITTQSGGVVMIRNKQEWSWLAPAGNHYRYISVTDDGQFLVASSRNSPETTLWRFQADLEQQQFEITSSDGGSVGFGKVDGQWHLLTSEHARYRWWRIQPHTAPQNVFDINRPSGYQKSALAILDGFGMAVAMDRATTRLLDPRDGTELMTLVDGYQKDRTIHLLFDPHSRRLATAIGEQGFAVWDLEKLQAEFINLRLGPIAKTSSLVLEQTD